MYNASVRKKVGISVFGLFGKRFGWYGQVMRESQKIVQEVNALEESFKLLSDDELREKSKELKSSLQNGKTMDDILVEAFALVREVSGRVLGMRHFDVQLIGGYILHKGMIAEMKTGEGKTLAATLAVYLNALSGDGVHVVTVNDYLARRDAEWMGKIYEFLGLTVGCVTHGMSNDARKEAYNCDVTYGTNNEFAFDYLRDNMRIDKDGKVQRGHVFVIVDEVDSIFIDEARTPLVISGPFPNNTGIYESLNGVIDMLLVEDYEIDEKARNVTLTDRGSEHVEKILVDMNFITEDIALYTKNNIRLLHNINQLLKAHKLFKRDIDYIVRNNQVMIIDEFTGRVMDGRRYSDGLHQALEAKEKVKIQDENQTLASITYQNYFRLYSKLSGMTGTAMTEWKEFLDIYGLRVVDIPTHMPVSRKDEDDEIYATMEEKYNAVVSLVEDCYKRKQPVLVGTVSIEKSESIAKILFDKGMKCNILNAKNHENEAYIIAQAGRPSAITIATNMAGRGTDIKLGGNAEMLIAGELKDCEDDKYAQECERIRREVEEGYNIVKDAGGLYVIGTERHEGRRIDNQLRGRSGRQGDPGNSKFFLSLEDDLLRIFGSNKVQGLLQKLGLSTGEAITHPWVTKALEKAQIKVEERNSEIRKSLFRFDGIMNEQRQVIFAQREKILQVKDYMQEFNNTRSSYNEKLVKEYIPQNTYYEDWNISDLTHEVRDVYTLDIDFASIAANEGVGLEEILDILNKRSEELFKQRQDMYGQELISAVQKRILIVTLDNLWREHLQTLDYLKQSIGLRSFSQKNPLSEFRREAFEMFESIIAVYKRDVLKHFSHVVLEGASDANSTSSASVSEIKKTDDMTFVSRNANCPCGSGKKYKYCCGKI